MKFNQEYIAVNLYEHLQKHFIEKNKAINITLEGEGVHWNCKVELENRSIKITCFEHRYYENIQPEYLLSFDEFGQNKAWGRTHNILEVIKSLEDWINDEQLDSLYNKYEFIDWLKRRIQEIEYQIIKVEPILEDAERKLISPWGSGLYDYTIQSKKRSCTLSGYGKNEPIRFILQWEDCNLFEVQHTDLPLLAKVLRKWLVDKIEPSKLESQYEWIQVGQVAKYYEIGEGIKGEFIESWNTIEKFYRESEARFTPRVLQLIHQLRQLRFDEKLRAGQSLYTFILSRARRHNLTQTQNFIALRFKLDKDEMIVTNKNDDKLIVGKVEFSDELSRLLEELATEEIN